MQKARYCLNGFWKIEMKATVPSHSHLFLFCNVYNIFKSLKDKIQVIGTFIYLLIPPPIKHLSYYSLMPSLTCLGSIPNQKGLMLKSFTYCLDAYNNTSTAGPASTKGLSGNVPEKVVPPLVFCSSFIAITHKTLF